MLYGDAGNAVEQRRDAAPVGDDHRRACGDGLGCGVAEIFVLGGHDEDIGVTVSGPFGVSREGTGKNELARPLPIALPFVEGGRACRTRRARRRRDVRRLKRAEAARRPAREDRGFFFERAGREKRISFAFEGMARDLRNKPRSGSESGAATPFLRRTIFSAGIPPEINSAFSCSAVEMMAAAPWSIFVPRETVISALQEEIANDGYEHADGFDDVGNFQHLRGRSGARAEEIVKAEDVDDVEILQAGAQVTGQGRDSNWLRGNETSWPGRWL